MKLTFISNYFTHHQQPLCDALAAKTSFSFFETSEMTDERKTLGWEQRIVPDYVKKLSDNGKAPEADVYLVGSVPSELLSALTHSGKPVFRYSERPLKNGNERLKYLPRRLKWKKLHPREMPLYLLCAGAFVRSDYESFGLFKNYAYRFGYFPETRLCNDIDALIRRKQPDTILWAGRFLDWKHPELAVKAAHFLRDAGLDFHLTFIGAGPMENTMRQEIAGLQLEEKVSVLPPMTPDEIRREMEKTQLFFFTSDRHEGWGAVLNEAMNAGCAVVASHLAGAAPTLIRHGENGMIFHSGDHTELADIAMKLLTDNERRAALGKSAYRTITESWNAEIAAERLLHVISLILKGEQTPFPYDDGPMSRAEKRKENWF